MSDARGALIVGAAPSPDPSGHYARVIGGASLVIAADAGLLLCLAAGRTPDVCVGDFDSTPAEALAEAVAAGVEVRRYPPDKDQSDLHLALSVAREMGAQAVRFTAAFHGRLDHTLAALGTVMAAAGLDAVCDEPEWIGYAVQAGDRGCLELSESPGAVISIMVLGGAARVTAEGFRYPLHSAVLDPISSLGLSNVAVVPRQRVEVDSGGVLVIVNRSDATRTLQSGLDWTDTL